MFVTFPYGNNTATINVDHVTYVVWGVPVQGATSGVTVGLVGGQTIDFNLIPAQIQQLEASLAEHNRRKG